jgi:hypothetical protein
MPYPGCFAFPFCPVLAILYRCPVPGCRVLAVLSILSILWFLAVMSSLSYGGCPDLTDLCCCPVPTVPSQLPVPRFYPCRDVLTILSSLRWPLLAVLSWLSCPSCPVPYALCQLSDTGCTVLAVCLGYSGLSYIENFSETVKVLSNTHA